MWRECVWLRGLTKNKVISEAEDRGISTQTKWAEMFLISANHLRGKLRSCLLACISNQGRETKENPNPRTQPGGQYCGVCTREAGGERWERGRGVGVEGGEGG